MPHNYYDTAGMAFVAYAEILADGTSPNMNSGVVTALVGLGQYTLTLPANLGQADNRMQMVISPKSHPLSGVPVCYEVDDTDPLIKRISMFAGTPTMTLSNHAFNVLVLRTITQPPANSPG